MNTQSGKAMSRRVRIAVVGAALLLAGSHPTGSALAQSLWQFPGQGAWALADNWEFGVPRDFSQAIIDNGGVAIVRDFNLGPPPHAEAREVILGYTPGGSGTLVVDLTGQARIDDSLYVGYEGTGTLKIIELGSVYVNDSSFLGLNVGSTGTAAVRNSSSYWGIRNNLSVGYFGTGALSITLGAVVVNNGANIGANSGSSGAASVDGPDSRWHNNGVLAVGSSGDGTLNITGGGVVTSSLGRISRSAGSTGSVLIDGANSRWDARFEFTMGLPGTGTSTLSVQNGGVLSAALGMTIGSLGTVRGNGTIIANVRNIGGTVAPGTSPGTLHITGSYGQNDGGKLQIELASPTSFDKLAVSGNLSLQPGSFAGAVLQVSLAGGYMPHSGQSFDILDWGSLSGVFEQVQLPPLAGALQWNTDLLHTFGVLSVVGPDPTFLAADFTENGVVDGADLARWRTNFGTGTTHLQGNADADGDVDGADFLIWQRQLGRSSVMAATEQVPEPMAIVLALLAVCGLALLRPRRRDFSPRLCPGVTRPHAFSRGGATPAKRPGLNQRYA